MIFLFPRWDMLIPWRVHHILRVWPAVAHGSVIGCRVMQGAIWNCIRPGRGGFGGLGAPEVLGKIERTSYCWHFCYKKSTNSVNVISMIWCIYVLMQYTHMPSKCFLFRSSNFSWSTAGTWRWPCQTHNGVWFPWDISDAGPMFSCEALEALAQIPCSGEAGESTSLWAWEFSCVREVESFQCGSIT